MIYLKSREALHTFKIQILKGQKGAEGMEDIEAKEIELTVKPLTTPVRLAALARAKRRIEQEHGEIDDLNTRVNLQIAYLIYELGAALIVEWSGVGDEQGNVVSPTPERIEALLDYFPIGDEFYKEICKIQAERLLSKKDSGVSASGISNETEAPNTARHASSSI